MKLDMKFLFVLLIVSILTGCGYLDNRKQKSWEKIFITEKKSLSGDLKSYSIPSKLKLNDFIKKFGQPVDTFDYNFRFKNDIIEYQGLLAPNVVSMKEFNDYVKLIDPIRKRLIKKYTYEEELNVYKLRKAYYRKMAQYEFKYKESRQERLNRIKEMIPNWDTIYIDNSILKDLYPNDSEYNLSFDLKAQNCIRYDFALSEKVTKESVYGTYSNDNDAQKSINTFGYILVDEKGDIRVIDNYYRFDDNENSAKDKNAKRNLIVIAIGIIGLIILSKIRSRRIFKKMQEKELLFLEEILNDARSLDIKSAKSKYYRLNKSLLINTGSESKFKEIEIRIKYTIDCTKCGNPNFVQSTIELVDTETDVYMTNGRYNKDGTLDKRYNTEYDYETTYEYKAHCDYCKKDFNFERSSKI